MSWPKECMLSEFEKEQVREIAKRWQIMLTTDDHIVFDIGYLLGLISKLTGSRITE